MKRIIIFKKLDKSNVKRIKRKKSVERVLGYIIKFQPLIIALIGCLLNGIYE